MATYTPFPYVHWCTGRNYPNAPADARIWCTQRPPPWYWIVEFTGWEHDFHSYNGEWVFPLALTAEGWNPRVEWWIHGGIFALGSMRIQWEPAGNPLLARRLVVHIGNAVNATQGAIFRVSGQPPVTDWFVYDDFAPPKIANIGGQPIGVNAAVRLHVGTYARIPARSCRGDYNGEWP